LKPSDKHVPPLVTTGLSRVQALMTFQASVTIARDAVTIEGSKASRAATLRLKSAALYLIFQGALHGRHD